MLTDFPKLFYAHRIYPKAIYHIGASDDGREAAFFAEFCPTVPAYYFEALPKVCARLVQKIEKYPNHRAFCALLSDKDGERVPFHVANNSGQSSSMLDFGTHTTHHPQVAFVHTLELTTARFGSFVEKNDLFVPIGSFLDIDVQGCERKVLEGFGLLLERFDWIYTEFSTEEIYKGCVLEPELDEFLAAAGFKTVARFPTEHKWGDKLFKRIGATL